MVRTPDFQSGNVEFNSLMGYQLCLVGEVAIILVCRTRVKGSEPLQGVYFEHFKIKYKRGDSAWSLSHVQVHARL